MPTLNECSTQIVVHPNFDNRTLANDIALVKMGKAARRKTNIDIVCVPSDQQLLPRNKTCYVTGWGKMSEGWSDEEVTYSFVKRAVYQIALF